MADEQLGNSPAGIIEKIPGLAYRTRGRYWRNFGTKDKPAWRQTDPLPSDIVGQAQYLARGFRLDNPNEVKPVIEQPKADNPDMDAILEENKRLRQELNLAKAREARFKKKEEPS